MSQRIQVGRRVERVMDSSGHVQRGEVIEKRGRWLTIRYDADTRGLHGVCTVPVDKVRLTQHKLNDQNGQRDTETPPRTGAEEPQE